MIIRRKHTANFTTIGNVLFRDERLKADEVGIIGYLLSQPHDWEVRRPALGRRWKMGREAIKRVLWNAMRHGWIVARKTQLADGRFHTVYEVRDEPGPELSDDEIRSALSLGSSDADESDAEGEGADAPTPETDPPDTGDPATGQPGVVQPATGNPYVVSKKETTKEGFTKDESTKRGRAFDDVNRTWPSDNILSATAAQTAFLNLGDADKEACFAGIRPYLADCKDKTRKICDLTTFIRERRWERFQAKAKPACVMIKPGSIEWHRWKDYAAATGDHAQLNVLVTMAKMNRDISVPSQWPPALPKDADAATGPPSAA